MSPGNRAQLLALANREFRELTNAKPKPEPNRKFKPIRLNPARFDQSWDRKRGAAVRMTSVLLRHDDVELENRVCENAKSAKTYADAADWLRRESEYLRGVARLVETASGRLSVVLTRCQTSGAETG
jgi:hypothetical protein